MINGHNDTEKRRKSRRGYKSAALASKAKILVPPLDCPIKVTLAGSPPKLAACLFVCLVG
jgi:hypothetical protein